MHESLRYLLEKVITFYSSSDYYNDLLRAKETYFQETGKAFEEDEDYEARMASFNDWYILQYCPDHQETTFFEKYVEENSILPELVESVRKTNHSLFEYNGQTFRGQHLLKDILHDTKFTLAKDHQSLPMVKGDFFIGRTTEYLNENYLYNGLRMMPKEAANLMKKQAKRIRKSNDKSKEEKFLLFTESLKTKWQRYGHVDVKKIFIFPEIAN